MSSFKCKICDKEYSSINGLRSHNIQKHNINAEQTYVDYVLNSIEPKCKCGCGLKPNFLSVEKGYVEYILGHVARVNNNWGHNQEALKKSHETQKKMHADGKLKVWNDGLTIADERVRKNVEASLSNPNRSKNISKKLSGVKKTDEHKKSIKLAADIRWSKPEERENQSHRRMQYIIKNGFSPKSKLEEIFKDILEKEFLMKEHHDYYRQYYVRDIKALFDFKISGKNILIEVDGDYWHCNPNSQFKEPIYEAQKGNLIQDKIKEEWCLKNGFKLLRFWESDINTKPEEIIKRLKEELNI
jgi:very-short-patch-repair endonuclease